MKQTLKLASLLLLVALLGACVENNESPSVTAVRNAKAEQLKGLAALYNAQAAAEQTIANAEAALLAAEAKYKEAEAEYQKLLNENQTTANQVAVEQAKVTLANLAQQMLSIERNAELALENHKVQLLYAQQSLTSAVENANSQEKQKLQNLAYDYTSAVSQLTSAQRTLLNYKQNLIALQHDLVDATVLKDETIADNNNQIAQWKMEIEYFKQYHNYTEDFDALELKYQEAQTKNNQAYDVYRGLYKTWDAIAEPTYEEKNDLEKDIKENALYKYLSNGQVLVGGKWVSSLMLSAYRTGYLSYNVSSSKEYEIKEEVGSYTYEYSMYIDEMSINDQLPTADIRKIENDYNGQKATIDATLKTDKTALETAQKAYDAAVKATADAKKAYDGAKAEEKDAKLDAYNKAIDAEAPLKDAVEAAQTQVDNTTKRIAGLDAEWAVYKNMEALFADFEAKAEAYNEAMVELWAEKVAAWKAYREAYIAYQEAYSEYEPLDILYNGHRSYSSYQDSEGNWYYSSYNETAGASTIDNYIELREGWIKDKEQANEKLFGIENAEAEIAYYEQQIEAQEQLVKAKEAAVATAKAELDAAMPAEEGAE
jgi:hypothetical protein